MNGEPPKTEPVPEDVPEDDAHTVPRSGSGAGSALLAMLRKRQMRAGAEPQAPQPDGGKPRRK